MRAGVIVYNPFFDKILLIHRWKNGQEYFVIPGGTIELGEGPLETALREMKEEVNLNFSADQLYTAFSLNNQGKEEYYFYTSLSTAETPLMQGEELERSSLQKHLPARMGQLARTLQPQSASKKPQIPALGISDAGKFEKLKHL